MSVIHEIDSLQQCRVRAWHQLPNERLAISVVATNKSGSVIWAISDLSGQGSLSVSSSLTDRSLAWASLAVSRSVMTFLAPGKSGVDVEKGQYLAPTVDCYLNMWGRGNVQSIEVCFVSDLGSSSKAVVEFALGDDLAKLIKLPQSVTQLIPWPA
jgi:hypothetical protein